MPKFRFIFVFIIFIIIGAVAFFIFPSRAVPDEQRGSVPDNNSSSAFILPASEPDYFPLRDFNVASPIVQAKSAVLFDTHSGKFLYQKDKDKPLPIASLTKLMTAVVILENLNINKDIKVSVENLNVDGYGPDFQKGETINGNDLLKFMLIKSSNDAALVFQTEAERQNIDLVTKMNSKAQELGMTSTRFTNPAGLDDTAFATASDLVKLVQYVGEHHKRIWDILKIKSIDISSSDGGIVHHIVNTDQLLGQISGIIGGKTGFTPVAMGTMILVVEVNGGSSDLVGVILGSNDRFSEVRQLIEWGQKAYRWR